MRKEEDILETTLALAENGYEEAYRFLRDVYEKDAEQCGPQTLYFLACLAGGAHLPEEALAWMKKAVRDNGWWYRPEVLEDDDLALLKDNVEFAALKDISDHRYADARSSAKAEFSWRKKTAENLLLAVHGNTQNSRMAREDWQLMMGENRQWQLETVQSAEPDGHGTYRWSYDTVSCLPVAEALQKARDAGYQRVAGGGFSAGCDMLLRAMPVSEARCDTLVLQSPWIPILKEQPEALIKALGQKRVELKIFCGSEDEDCLPLAEQLHALAEQAGLQTALSIQPGRRHQFPEEPCALFD